jgi:pyrroloquinoline quinone biosynthesis protein A
MRRTAQARILSTVPAVDLKVRKLPFSNSTPRRNRMKWEKPAASDMRFGFEITMYIANR